MHNTNSENTLIIGIGNEYRTDDAAGILAVRKIKQLSIPGVDICENCGDGMELIEQWKSRKKVILIDAVLSGSPPGTIHRLNAQSAELNSNSFRFSSHLFSVPDAISLSSSLGTLPGDFTIFGIEARSMENGQKLSPEVEDAVTNIEHVLKQELC